MVANDACKPTFLYSRKREKEQSTPFKGYCSTDITLYKDCTIKKWKAIDQQYDYIIKFELHSNQPTIAIYKLNTVNKLFKKWCIKNADYTNYSRHISDLIYTKRKTLSKTSNIHHIYNNMTKSIITAASKHFKRGYYEQFDINARVASIKEIRDIAKQLNKMRFDVNLLITEYATQHAIRPSH